MRTLPQWWYTGRCWRRLVSPWGLRLGVVWLLVVGSAAAAQWVPTEARVIEALRRGQVNWTEGLVLSRDSATGTASQGAGALTRQAAAQAARQGLLVVLDQVRLDARQ